MLHDDTALAWQLIMQWLLNNSYRTLHCSCSHVGIILLGLCLYCNIQSTIAVQRFCSHSVQREQNRAKIAKFSLAFHDSSKSAISSAAIPLRFMRCSKISDAHH